MPIENLLSVSEAAERIGCTDGRVRQLLRAGLLLGKKLNGRAWGVFDESVTRFLSRPKTTGRPRVSA